MTPREFEDKIRNSVVLEKLRAALTDWITVSDAEVDEEYRRRNEKVKLELVSMPADDVPRGPARRPTRKWPTTSRRTRRVTASASGARSGTCWSTSQEMRDDGRGAAQDVERSYNQNIDQYTTPEQVRASHILLKTEGKDEAAVRAQAEKVLAEAQGRAPTSRRSRRSTRRTKSNASQGGDLDFFGAAAWCRSSTQAAFALRAGHDQRPGEDAVRLPHHQGHRQEGGRRCDRSTRCARRSPSRSSGSARRRAADLSRPSAAEVKTPADLDKAANVTRPDGAGVGAVLPRRADRRARGLAGGLRAGLHAEGRRGQRAAAHGTGVAFLAVTGREDSRVPTLDEVKESATTV